MLNSSHEEARGEAHHLNSLLLKLKFVLIALDFRRCLGIRLLCIRFPPCLRAHEHEDQRAGCNGVASDERDSK